MTTNPYAPQEPAELLFLEHCDFAGIHISEIFFGFSIILFFRCIIALLWPQRTGRQRNYYLVLYTLVLFGLGTVFMAMNVHLMQLGFIDNRNFPGGPEAYELSVYSTAVALTPNATFIIANWLADGLLLYRCRIIWQGKAWVLALPVVLYLADIAMGVLYLYQLSVPTATLFTEDAVDFGLPYFSLATTLNVLLTLMISSRLLIHQRRLKAVQSLPSSNGLSYMPIVAMLVESSALYAVFSLVFIGTYAAGSSASAIFLPILSQTQIIAPLLIIARVSAKKAWTSADSYSANRAPGRSWSGNAKPTSGSTTRIDNIPLEPSPKFRTFGDISRSDEIQTHTTVDIKVA